MYKKKIPSTDDPKTCCGCNEKNPAEVCQFCDQPVCDNCTGNCHTENKPFLRCECGLVGPGDGHECNGMSNIDYWMGWCKGCQQWHCYSCSAAGCYDSDVEDDDNQHLQASYKNCKEPYMSPMIDTGMGSVHCVAVSRDNAQVASGYDEGTIIIHSIKTATVEFRADNVFAGEVNGICYFPNGSGLVACGNDFEFNEEEEEDEDDGDNVNLKVFSPSLELVQTLVGHDGSVWCVTVSPSGSHFASGGVDGKVMIWSEPGEGGEWARVQVLEDHTDTIRAVCFSPDGKQLATGGDDKLIKTYSFNEGSAILAHTLEGHTHYVRSLSFSPDSKLLCSGSMDKSIKFWNPADGSLVKSIDQAHTSYSVDSVSYSPNGRVLVSAGSNGDKTMKIWDAETFELKHTFEQEFYTVQLTISADSNFIVSANDDNTVRFTSCREYHLTGLTPILNLILHIVYKWEFVSFLEQNENTSPLEKVVRLLGECVHDGGYNVTSEILSFLSPAHLPVQITPTRWSPTK